MEENRNDQEVKNPDAQETDNTLMTGGEFRMAMNRIEEANDQQAIYAKKQFILSRISMIISAGVLCIVLIVIAIFVPKVNSLMDEAEDSLESIKTFSKELSEIDIQGVVENVNNFTKTGEETIKESMGKLNSIDFETLNNAISDLESVVKPLAELFGN